EAAEVGEADVEVGVAAGDAGGGRVGERRGAPRGHDAPLRAGELGETLTDAVRQLVEVDVALRGRGHGLAYLGQHRGAAQDRVRAAGVDDRPHADRLVDVRDGARGRDPG